MRSQEDGVSEKTYLLLDESQEHEHSVHLVDEQLPDDLSKCECGSDAHTGMSCEDRMKLAGELEQDQHLDELQDNQDTAVDSPSFYNSPLCGYLWVAISSCVFSIGNLVMKLTSKRGVPAFQAISARGIIQLFLVGIVLWRNSVNPFSFESRSLRRRWKKFLFLCLHGLSSLLGIAGFYIGLKYLTISAATVLFFTSLLWTAVLGFVWLGERMGAFGIAALIIGVCGSIFCAKPPFLFHSSAPTDGYPIFGIAVVNFAALCMGIGYIVVRKVQHDYQMDPQLSVFYNALFSAVVSPYVSMFAEEGNQMIDFSTLTLMASLGVWTFIGQLLMNTGFKYAPAGSAALLRNFDVVFSFIFDLMLFHNPPNMYMLTGAGLVIFSSILLVMDRKHATVSATHRRRRSSISVAS